LTKNTCNNNVELGIFASIGQGLLTEYFYRAIMECRIKNNVTLFLGS